MFGFLYMQEVEIYDNTKHLKCTCSLLDIKCSWIVIRETFVM